MDAPLPLSTAVRLLLLAAAGYFFLRLPPLPFNSIPSLELHPTPPPPHVDPCTSRYIYVHNLPARFNSDLLLRCGDLDPWTNMCPFLLNYGFGEPLLDRAPAGAWYGTHQFSLDVVFHARMRAYECQTLDPSKASAVFVPFYAGLDAGMHLWSREGNATARDERALELAAWLRARPEWRVMSGRDHFMVAGRITWDFRRPWGDDNASAWGNRLLLLPEVRNMTALVLETSPRRGREEDEAEPDVAVPYPTYFHPRSAAELSQWQEHVRRLRRKWLFSFAGGPRADEPVRAAVIRQCRASKHCRMLDCEGKADGRCRSPAGVMAAFERSVFCLQPPGDSLTRKSTFDSMVAGCIPVFFGNESAEEQYTWHFGSGRGGAYSVVIEQEEMAEGRIRVEEVLTRIGKAKIKSMRDEVIKMITRLVYRHPEWDGQDVRDAFDVALEGVLARVERRRKERLVCGINLVV